MFERPLKAADLPEIAEVFNASIRALALPYYTPEQIDAWAPVPPDSDRWGKRLAGLTTWLIESEGRIAGFISYTDAGYLDFLYTHPAFARRGVGTRLYTRMEESLAAFGVRRIETHASLAARAFFESQGFQIDREEVAECRGSYLRRFAMHKDLSSCGGDGKATGMAS
jgi:putative acetyltransferase